MPEQGKDAIVAGRYRIEAGQRLPQFDQPSGLAFAVRDEQAPAEGHFAVICKPNVQPRSDPIVKLSRQELPGLLCPRALERVYWRPDDAERAAVIFPVPQGQRLVSRPDERFKPFSEDRVMREVLPRLVTVLRDLGNRYLTHRALRPDNLFLCGDRGRDTLLGECVTAPPGLFQPVVYETIEDGQALPSGRGVGRTSDDLYALGVLLLALLCGGDPMAGLDDDGVVLSKIRRGSCAALIGKRRVSSVTMEPLRGLLFDDEKDRWTIDDLEQWLSGRHMSPKQTLLPNRAQRPLVVAGRDCEMDREAAHVLASNWPEGIRLAASGELDGWVRRSLGDEERGKNISGYRLSGVGAPGESDALLTRAVTILDPKAPLRYKNFAARLEAIPAVLAQEFHNDELRQTIAEVISTRLPLHWMELQHEGRSAFVAFKKLYEILHATLVNPTFGFGIERCLYEANPDWPCQSPILARHRVTKIGQLLPALEEVAARQAGGESTEFVDRHIAAFCGANATGISTALLQGLDERDDIAARRLAILKLLAAIQQTTGPSSLPNLARAMALLLEPAIQSFHNRPFREALIAQVEAAAAAGNLPGLLAALDDPQVRQGDEAGFEQAHLLHQEISQEIEWLEGGGLTKPAHVEGVGRQAAVVVSTLAAVTAAVVTVAVEIFSF